MLSLLKKRPVAFQWPGAGCTLVEGKVLVTSGYADYAINLKKPDVTCIPNITCEVSVVIYTKLVFLIFADMLCVLFSWFVDVLYL